MKPLAYLIGPFIGELYWEMYRFAPYIIHLKKENPNYKLIVFTRPNRFDLYGTYADILVPLNFRNENRYVQNGFGIDKFECYKYNMLKDFLYKKYKKRYTINRHILPDIETWKKKIKWQFPRDEMDYDFRPRKKNYSTIKNLFDSTCNVFVDNSDSDIRHSLLHRKYDPIMKHWLKDIVKNKKNTKVSYIGCLIVLMRDCKFIVANMKSDVARLALLLNIPVISVDEEISYDEISLMNPFNVPVINCHSIEEGVDIYENNF
jgi:hypothetical protein